MQNNHSDFHFSTGEFLKTKQYFASALLETFILTAILFIKSQ